MSDPSTLKKWFDTVDKDNSGEIDYKELQGALSQNNFKFSDECSIMMVNMFDSSHNQKLVFKEFVACHNYLITMQSAYFKVDTNKNGSLDMNELYRAVTSCGYKIDTSSFAMIFKKFDRQVKGYLGLDGYIEMCVFLGVAKQVFAQRDSNRDGIASFNFNQFIQAASCFK